MNVIMKLVFLIYLTSVVTCAAPAWEHLVTIPMDDINGVHDRETRSSGIPWYLDRIDQRRSRQLNGKYNAFASGTGVDIYVLADGIDYEDKEFNKRAFGVELSHYQRRCNKLGTHIGRLAAGVYAGVAKNSNIIVPRITIDLLTCRLITTYRNVKMGIHWVIESVKRTGRRSVLVIPLAISRSYFWNDVAEEAIKENIVVVTPAGNSLHDACHYSPGSSPQVINVGATNRGKKRDDKLYESNFGRCVSLYAPALYRKGTVQACALVAGAAALVLEKYPDYTPAQVKQHLIDEATDGAINMKMSPEANEGANKLLYVGYDEGSGNYLEGITP